MMGKKINEAEAVAFLKEHDRFLIFTHNSPDADTIGSAAALVLCLRRLGKQAYAFNREGIPSHLAFLCPPDVFLDRLPNVDGHTLMSVDVASPSVLASEDGALTFALSIDHHESSSVPCDLLYLQDRYPATGEIIYELIRALGIQPDEAMAVALYAAISSDSGGFRFSYTRPATMRAAAELMETGIDFARINRLLFESRTPSQIAMERLGYEKLEMHFGGRFAMIAVTADELSKANARETDTECLNQLPRRIAGVELSAVIKPKNGTVKVSLRSNENINVSELAAGFGGGGHFHAAGFSCPGCTVEAVKERLLQTVKTVLA